MTTTASETEASAIVAAVEQFLADTAPPPAASEPRPSAWQRTALEEGVSARQFDATGWGRPRARHRQTG